MLILATATKPPEWVWNMSPQAWFTIIAIIAGPILAVQAQKWIERSREVRGRKLWLFRELMATRGTRLSPRHVEALNLIELEYDATKEKQRPVHEAWRSYFDALNSAPPDPKSPQSHYVRRDDLLVDLLYEMGRYLGFKYDKVAIRRNSYTPQGHGEAENDLLIIRKGLAKIFTSKSYGVPIRDVDHDFEAPPLITAEDFGGSPPAFQPPADQKKA